MTPHPTKQETKLIVPPSVKSAGKWSRILNVAAVASSAAVAAGYALGEVSPKWSIIAILAGQSVSSVSERLQGGLSSAKQEVEEIEGTELKRKMTHPDEY